MELFGWLKSIKSRVRRFSGAQLNRISFPLGGVAAESIGRGGQGDLRDWQIFLRPDQGHSPAWRNLTVKHNATGRSRDARLMRQLAGLEKRSQRSVHPSSIGCVRPIRGRVRTRGIATHT